MFVAFNLFVLGNVLDSLLGKAHGPLVANFVMHRVHVVFQWERRMLALQRLRGAVLKFRERNAEYEKVFFYATR